MLEHCRDACTIQFHDFADMLLHHDDEAAHSVWERTEVNALRVEPLDEGSPLYSDIASFGGGVTKGALIDTAKNLGLAIRLGGTYFPLRDTAYKSLTDRAKIGGSSLPKLSRQILADTLNECLALQKNAQALLLIRSQKVSAVHSGDGSDYAILPINELLAAIKAKLDERFPGSAFDSGYSSHELTSAAWSLPGQKSDLLGSYHKTLDALGKTSLATKLMPGIRFSTSDTGIAAAKVSALLFGMAYPIPIGSMVGTEHRGRATVADFMDSLDLLFAQFEDSVKRLEQLMDVYLTYPVNAMTAICKRLSLPKKASLDAIAMFEMANGGGSATAHDVFFAMQEIMFLLKSEEVRTGKMLQLEESMSRALSLNWAQYDYAKAVSW